MNSSAHILFFLGCFFLLVLMYPFAVPFSRYPVGSAYLCPPPIGACGFLAFLSFLCSISTPIVPLSRWLSKFGVVHLTCHITCNSRTTIGGHNGIPFLHANLSRFIHCNINF